MLCWFTIILSTQSQGASLVLRSYTEAMDRSKGSSVQAVWNRDLKIGVLAAASCFCDLLVLYGFVVLVVCWLVHYMYCNTVIPMYASVSRFFGGRCLQGGKWVIHKYDATPPKAVCSKGRAAVKTNHHSAGCGQVRGYWGDIVNGQGTQHLWKALPWCVPGCALNNSNLVIGC